MQYSLGVDLGTTWIAAVVDDGEELRPLTLGDQGPALASVIARDGDSFVFGTAAERQILVAPASGVREVKRRVGDSAPIIVAGTPYSADALLGAMLAHVVEVATQQLGGAPDRVVLTHPAVWGEYKLDVLRAAALAAGLAEVELLPEPTAAAMHYATLDKLQPGETVAVYDFGGGTFDAAVIRRGDDGFEVLGTPEGIERLGGIDLDQAVLAHVDAAVDGKLRELDRESPEVRQSLARLRDECVRAKEALSADTEASIPVDVPGLQTTVRLTRAEFEAMVRPRLDETMVALERSVASAGIGYENLVSVLLVGGSSRIPVVSEVVGAATGRPTAIDAHPKLVVASGAAARVVLPAFDDAGGIAGGDGEASGEAGAAGRGAKGKGGAGEGAAAGKSGKRSARLGGAGVAAAVAGVAGVVAAADAVFGGDTAGAATGHIGDPQHQADEHKAAEEHAAQAREAEHGRPGEEHRGGDERARGAGEEHRGTVATERGDAREHVARESAAREHAVREQAAMAASARSHLMGNDGGHVQHEGGGGGAMAATRMHEASRGEPAPHMAPAPPQHAAEAPHMAPAAHAAEPQHAAAPAPATHAAEPQHAPDPFDTYREQMIERLGSWAGPPGASPQEVANLRQELAAVIHRAEHVPGQSLDNARADLEDRLDDKLHVYETDHKVDALIQQEQHENEMHVREVGFSQLFTSYQGYAAQGMENWKPAGWDEGSPSNGAALAHFKAEVTGLLVSMRYDPNKPYAVQEKALHDTIQGMAQTFQNEQLVQHQKDYNAELDAKFLATHNEERTDIQKWQIKGELEKITAEKKAFNDGIAGHLSAKFDASFVPSVNESPDDDIRASAHVFDRFGPPPPTPAQLAAQQQAAEQQAAQHQQMGEPQMGDQPMGEHQMAEHQMGEHQTGDQPGGEHHTGDQQLPAHAQTMAMGEHVAGAAFGDVFDDGPSGPNGGVADPILHVPMGTGTDGAQQPAAAQTGSDGTHTLTPGAVHQDFLGTAAATEHLNAIAATTNADAGAMAHPGMPGDATHPMAQAEPDPPHPGVHDMPFGIPDHNAAGNGADAPDPAHHDPGMFGEHHPGDPDAHHMGMGEPTHHDATNPFGHPDDGAPDHHDDPVLVMHHDDPAPMMPDPDDDMP